MRWVVAAVVVVAGCGRIGFDPRDPRDLDDGGGVGDGAPDATACTFGPWSTPVHLATLGSMADDFAPALHPDGQVLVFERNSDLYAATRTGMTTFSAPVTATALNSGSNDSSPSWSADGTKLYFTSNRSGSYRLWVSAWDNTTFGPPTESLDLNQIDGPDLSRDGLELVYCTIPGPNDLGRATRATLTSPWVNRGTVDFAAVNTGATEGFPTLSGDGTAVYFETTRNGPAEIYMTTRTGVGQPFGAPTAVTELNAGGGSNVDGDISNDGATMMFASDRLGGSTGFELFITTRSCL